MATYKKNFIKAVLDKLTIPINGRDYYYDTKAAGLILDVTSKGKKNYYLYKKVQGRPMRFKIGSYNELSIENARKAVADYKNQIKLGKNPNDERRKIRAEITFGQMFIQFMERYSKPHKRSWWHDEREVNKFLSNWFNRKALAITKYEVQVVQETIRKENGLYQSNRLLERIRAIYNKGIEWGWEGKIQLMA